MTPNRTIGLVFAGTLLLTLLGLQRGASGAGSLEERLRAVEVDGQWFFSKRVVITDLNEEWRP